MWETLFNSLQHPTPLSVTQVNTFPEDSVCASTLVALTEEGRTTNSLAGRTWEVRGSNEFTV